MTAVTPRCLAIVPARGGSKGLPRKNVLPLCGKPLIAWTIEAARAAERVDRVVVSTDDPEIAEVSRRFGAEVVTRPESISGDGAKSEDALIHTLETLAERDGYRPDAVAFLQCTSPLTAPQDIDGTVAKITDDGADTALAVIDFHYFLWTPASANKSAEGINHDKSVRQLRQERDPQYLETGAVYAMRTAGFLEHRHRFFGRTATHAIPASRRLEIDEPADFAVAEALLRQRLAGDRAALLPDPIDAVVSDFDGVWTDNRVTVDQDGKESVTCSRGDGMGLGLLKKAGVPVLVISKERNPVVLRRCEKLGVECLHAIDDKPPAVRRWLEKHGLRVEKTVYLGNDVNDAGCLEMVGCGVVVADAHPSVVPLASVVLERPGGHGAVREACDMILAHRSGGRG